MTTPINMISAFREQDDPEPVPAGTGYSGIVRSTEVKATAKGTPYVSVRVEHDPMGDFPGRTHEIKMWLTPKSIRFFRRAFRDFGGDPDALPEKGSDSDISAAELNSMVNEAFTNQECLFDVSVKDPDEWNDIPWNDVRGLRPA